MENTVVNGYQASISHLSQPINLMLSLEFVEDETGEMSDIDVIEAESGGLESVCADFSSPMNEAQMADFMARIDAIKNLSAKELADWDAAVIKGAKFGQIIPPPGYVPMFSEPVNNSIVKIDEPEPTDEDLARIERAIARAKERKASRK